jgi:hypothetical protein
VKKAFKAQVVIDREIWDGFGEVMRNYFERNASEGVRMIITDFMLHHDSWKERTFKAKEKGDEVEFKRLLAEAADKHMWLRMSA